MENNILVEKQEMPRHIALLPITYPDWFPEGLRFDLDLAKLVSFGPLSLDISRLEIYD